MKQMLKSLLTVTALMSVGAAFADCDGGCNSCDTKCCSDNNSGCHRSAIMYMPRSVSENAAKDMVGIETYLNRFDMEKLNGVFYMTPEYGQSFKHCRMAQSLFGEAFEDGHLTISGSRKGYATVPAYVARGSHEILADYFGLPTDFVSTVSFKPKIQNFSLDLGIYLGLDELWEGGFFKIHAPIHWTKWRLHPGETIVNKGTLGYDAGYMAAAAVTNANLWDSWLGAMSGDEDTFGDMTEALAYGKIAECSKSKTRLADIQVALGWNFLQNEDYHFGLMIRGAFPTGNKPRSEYLFEPLSGNGHHWELGGGLTAHACLWRSEDEESMFNVYLDANITHLFKDKQTRSFDFEDAPLSRYMLIEQLGTPVANLYAGAAYNTPPVAPSAQYQKKLFHAINKTTSCVNVSVDVQGDMALKFAYITGGWDIDLGYNLWGRTGEKFHGTDDILPAKTYALKGDAFIYGFGASDATTLAIRGLAVPLSATESNATIYNGTNTPNSAAFATPAQLLNPNVDNATFAFGTANVNASDALQYAQGAYNIINNQRTSSTPKYVGDLETKKGPAALSNKVFANVSYAWKDREESDWIPLLGIGGECEFGAKTDGNWSAVSQWGVWVKGGLAFN